MGGLAVTPLAALAEVIGLETVADLCALLPLPAALIALSLRARRPENAHGGGPHPPAPSPLRGRGGERMER